MTKRTSISSIDEIITFLKHNGGRLHCEASRGYMAFDAELQDWSFAEPEMERLFLSYYFKQNGDVCNDPLLILDIRNGRVVSIAFNHWLTGSVPCDPQYAADFIQLVYERHFLTAD